ncbi:MAG: DNA mismatch endonuclease Vsr [Halothiobacillaceae bacterium]|nr:MAG: DNA mismatch endonuclease Vsr [Halothiobacillaceae bacterium]
MVDVVDKQTRSRIMSSIRGHDTRPERMVRSWLYAHGFRFRLQRKDLPGKPDIVLPKYRAVVFVHGCFWHRHEGCRYATIPASNREVWIRKFEANMVRDAAVKDELMKAGWRVFEVWECSLKKDAGRSLERLGEMIRSVSMNNGIVP